MENLYVPKFNPGAHEALEKGTLSRKVDGQCGAIVQIDGTPMLATRYDDQKGKVHLDSGNKTGFSKCLKGKNPFMLRERGWPLNAFSVKNILNV